jgi:hypothetical protein
MLNETSAGLVMDHIIKCRLCATALHILADDSPETLTADEEALIANLPSAQPEGRRRIAKRIVQSARAWLRPLLIAASIIIVIAGAGGWYGMQRAHRTSPQALLAQAYSTARPFEYRLSGMPYGRFVQTMGQNSANKPAEIADALDTLEPALAKAPDNPELLDASGRAELLARDLIAAEAPLQKAHSLRPSDPTIATDLAVLWAYRAQATGDAALTTQSLALFDDILRRSPAESAARFDRALVLVRLNRISEATAEFQLCLTQERDPGWSGEISSRLQDLAREH